MLASSTVGGTSHCSQCARLWFNSPSSCECTRVNRRLDCHCLLFKEVRWYLPRHLLLKCCTLMSMRLTIHVLPSLLTCSRYLSTLCYESKAYIPPCSAAIAVSSTCVAPFCRRVLSSRISSVCTIHQCFVLFCHDPFLKIQQLKSDPIQLVTNAFIMSFQ